MSLSDYGGEEGEVITQAGAEGGLGDAEAPMRFSIGRRAYETLEKYLSSAVGRSGAFLFFYLDVPTRSYFLSRKKNDAGGTSTGWTSSTPCARSASRAGRAKGRRGCFIGSIRCGRRGPNRVCSHKVSFPLIVADGPVFFTSLVSRTIPELVPCAPTGVSRWEAAQESVRALYGVTYPYLDV